MSRGLTMCAGCDEETECECGIPGDHYSECPECQDFHCADEDC